ncbi:MAG: PAS domain-containing protein [Prolixibacteraceae bacterium]|nr:PAS domain-containing protein [Prolixibacteraceae bacterium]MBN2774473.1 PAS domain-containing protein [Prolixibacteraceae bacterium]
MGNSIILGLIQNVAILLTITLLYDYILINRRWGQGILIKIINGIIIGGLGIVVMLTPWTYVPGIVFDTRSVILSISGLFFGLIPTLIAILLTGIFRVFEGGDGTWMGIAVIISSGLIGILWRNLRPNWQNRKYTIELILMGLLVHITMLGCTALLPGKLFIDTFKTIALPVLIIYPAGTMLIGLLMLNRIRLWRTKKELQESEERWQFALEGAGDGLWDWNTKTSEVFFSKQWKKMLGYEDHEINNNLDEWDKRVHPDDKEKTYSDLNRHFSGETSVYINEHRLLCKDGSYKWILDRGKVISRLEDGSPLRVIGIHSDISERKKWEEKFKELYNELEKRVAERTKELELKNFELQKFNELFVGREFRIKELKDKVKELEEKLSGK